jgi:hypothetical protein
MYMVQNKKFLNYDPHVVELNTKSIIKYDFKVYLTFWESLKFPDMI